MSRVLWDVTILEPGPEEDVVYGTMQGVAVHFDPWLYQTVIKDEHGVVVDRLDADTRSRAVVHDGGVTIFRLAHKDSGRVLKLDLAPHAGTRRP